MSEHCFICKAPLIAGEIVLCDVTEGVGHRACFGEDCDGYVRDSGEPLGSDDRIPEGHVYVPENTSSSLVGTFVSDEELEQWALKRADDAGRLARELIVYRRLNSGGSGRPDE